MSPVRSQSKWYVYLLVSQRNGKWYTGSTNDLQKRILTHNNSRNTSTKSGVPWKLIYYEVSLNRDDARARERYLKSGMGKRYINNRLKLFFAKGF
ncbi:hypothetical protein A2810_03015 [candidate division Kazan bacterium RIFCSPHIGHO2_01_FULL_49_10]|uniref:GIY-YIG domain-containing protein n=1 Tax=candidate division Kazan bacterium RIFCSPLOWO2_01_FULL_48_13 TaxID=1798539 RepID=A0A1F4PNZ5_UNCK3|nr:MAG: hypothetical protein A2810_03015 [candidate division Kazan bacterium RIFCSPHIGHO2_01_FULL_49_10]OGB85349.1 MAG: hypothetical protein A2994_01815 [candidate division Kazan bacterium RIFCSPLOWO2_01_FULL_48_13]